ncbi:hypothetical protein MMC25_001079 [Agyrium rufum]|nr:hypothetical protein [Agyrium rufum]
MSASVNVLTANVKKVLSKRPSLPSVSLPSSTNMTDSSWADVSSESTPKPERHPYDKRIVEGLRGISAIFVVSSHMVLCFARRLVVPCCSNDERTPLLFQRPIFRLVAQGQAWVALFFILSGFVNALKPLKLARAGQTENALANLANSAFRRPFRLVLPAALAAIISWAVCQLGWYEISRNSDAFWLYTYTPEPSASWGTAIEDLVNGLRATWTWGVINPYDQPQWALIYLFQGSMMVFAALLITVNLTPFYRSLAIGFFALWSFDLSYKFRDPLVGFTMFGGILLAEFSLSSYPQKLSRYSLLLSPPLAIFALILMSVPSDFAGNVPWSATLVALGQKYAPPQIDFSRFYGSFGGLLLVVSIIISPYFRALLSRPALLWLGKISFPIYLLHGTFMRSIFAWMMFYGVEKEEMQVQENEVVYTVMRHPLPGVMRTFMSVVVSMGLCLLAAHYWAGKVEPVFGRMTMRVEQEMSGKYDGTSPAGKPVLPVRKE